MIELKQIAKVTSLAFNEPDRIDEVLKDPKTQQLAVQRRWWLDGDDQVTAEDRR